MNHMEDLIARVKRARQIKGKQAAVVEVDRKKYQDDEDYTPAGVGGLLAASEKLLAINRGLDQPDHRDGLAFKRVMTPDSILRERIRMDESGMARKLMRMVSFRKTLAPISAFAFDNYSEKMLVGSPLAAPAEEINPMQHVENARRMTLMGPGGIGSRDALTAEMQSVNADQFGFIDTLAGPESEMAGVDTRLASGVRIGSDKKLYQQFRNKRTGEMEWISPDMLYNKVVKLPD